MSDHLEDFIKANRKAFDDQNPPEEIWEKIKSTLPGKKQPWYDNVVLWRAAAMIFMALSFYLLIPKQGVEEVHSNTALNEFNDVEAFYTKQISQKVAMIEEFDQTGSKEEFTQDFQQLEAMYMVLKEEWKVRPTKKVKDALVLNLLVRINLLNQQLQRLEEELRHDTKGEKKQNQSI